MNDYFIIGFKKIAIQLKTIRSAAREARKVKKYHQAERLERGGDVRKANLALKRAQEQLSIAKASTKKSKTTAPGLGKEKRMSARKDPYSGTFQDSIKKIERSY